MWYNHQQLHLFPFGIGVMYIREKTVRGRERNAEFLYIRLFPSYYPPPLLRPHFSAVNLMGEVLRPDFVSLLTECSGSAVSPKFSLVYVLTNWSFPMFFS